MEKNSMIKFGFIMYENGKKIETANVSLPTISIFQKNIEFETTNDLEEKNKRNMTNPFKININSS
jgi:hypothetical protein